MRVKLYSVFDRKMNVYMSPFVARGDVDALRQVKASVKSPDIGSTPVGTHPEDFDLVRLAEMDDETGGIYADPVPLVLGNIRSITGDDGASTVSS